MHAPAKRTLRLTPALVGVTLAALSAASSVQRGRPACPSARQTAGANGAGLTDCRVIGEVVVVETTVTVPAFFGRTMLVRARARAGPVGP